MSIASPRKHPCALAVGRLEVGNGSVFRSTLNNDPDGCVREKVTFDFGFDFICDVFDDSITLTISHNPNLNLLFVPASVNQPHGWCNCSEKRSLNR